MLMAILYYQPTEEQSGKWDAVRSAGSSGLEVVLTLLAEAVAVYVQVPIIEVGELSFEKLFVRARLVILLQ